MAVVDRSLEHLTEIFPAGGRPGNETNFPSRDPKYLPQPFSPENPAVTAQVDLKTALIHREQHIKIGQEITLPDGSSLTLKGDGTGQITQNTYSALNKYLSPQELREIRQTRIDMGLESNTVALQSVADLARSLIGTPYGSKSGYDCQTFLQHVYEKVYGMDFQRQPNGARWPVPDDRGNHIAFNHMEKVASLDLRNGQHFATEGNLNDIKPGMMVGIGHDLNGVPMNQSHYHLGIVGNVIRDQSGDVVDFTVINASGYYARNGSPRGRGVVEEKASSIPQYSRNDPHYNRMFILTPSHHEETQRARRIEGGTLR
jgi:hypothetical protein